MARFYGASDPTGTARAEYVEGHRAATCAAVGFAIDVLEHEEGRSLPIPAAILGQVRLTARSGVRLEAVMRRYVAGCVLLGDFLRAEAQQCAVETPRVGELLPSFADVLDRVLAAVSDEYEREIQKHWKAVGNGNAECVERLLAGEGPVDTDRFGYDLDVTHIGVSVQGLEGAKSIRELAASLGQHSLMLEREDAQIWAWLGSRCRIQLDELEKRIVATMPLDVTVGLGEPAEGVVGWRLTRRQANAALSIALRRPQRIVRYLDLGPEVAVLQDEALASSWVERYLSPLDDMSFGGQVARETLRALFAAEHNVSSAAYALGVHRSTVHRWRNDIEERLGCRLCEQQVGIEIALRIEELSRDDRALA
jgi:hypothetical protein